MQPAPPPVVPVELTDASARAVGTAIREAAQVVAVPIENPRELRAICIKLALETKGVTYAVNDHETWDATADRVLGVARRYHAFILDDEGLSDKDDKDKDDTYDR